MAYKFISDGDYLALIDVLAGKKKKTADNQVFKQFGEKTMKAELGRDLSRQEKAELKRLRADLIGAADVVRVAIEKQEILEAVAKVEAEMRAKQEELTKQVQARTEAQEKKRTRRGKQEARRIMHRAQLTARVEADTDKAIKKQTKVVNQIVRRHEKGADKLAAIKIKAAETIQAVEVKAAEYDEDAEVVLERRDERLAKLEEQHEARIQKTIEKAEEKHEKLRNVAADTRTVELPRVTEQQALLVEEAEAKLDDLEALVAKAQEVLGHLGAERERLLAELTALEALVVKVTA